MIPLTSFEHLGDPLAPRGRFFRRLGANVALALMFIAVSLAAGMAGYHWLGGLGWIDSFLNAAMILSGMGPVDTLQNDGAKVFAGLYAIYSGLLVVATSALIFAPVLHRLLHKLHVKNEQDPDDDDEDEAPPPKR
jgi:TRAP-type C4-dicarboxylate transport system permease small subunit